MNKKRRVGVDIKHEGRNSLTGHDILACARLAERCGYDSVWTNEDIGYDSIALLSALAPQTSTIQLGTAIVNVYNRSPMQIAMAAATLDELSGGRFTLGLSVGHHPWNDLGHGIPLEAPLARLRETVDIVRKAAGGARFTHDGRTFKGIDTQLAFEPARSRIPIYVGGERPGIIKLAGEIADGLIVNVVAPEYIGNFVVDHFRASARSAGRDAEALEIMGVVTCCVSEDSASSLRAACETFMNRLAANPEKMLETQPTQNHAELKELIDLVGMGKRAEAQRIVSDTLVSSIVATGTPAQAWSKIQQYFDAGCTRVAIAAFPRGRRQVEATIELLSTTAPSGIEIGPLRAAVP
jgi:alkanesulfonate monooxygenase SsuD/methylene tetrahydromethanopterin reductase-like flavin-dependent oxidoreductase (luciferase family)